MMAAHHSIAEQGKPCMNSLLIKRVLVIVVFAVVSSAAIQAQQANKADNAPPAQPRQPNSVEQRKTQLEIEKLELEVARLKENNSSWPSWLTGLLGLVLGATGTAGTIWVARRARRQGTDQVTHEARLACYPKLVKATAPLAIYFSAPGEAGALTRERCYVMGRKISDWYFASGGLLMSNKTRDAYFVLARALTRASLAPELKVPSFPADADQISADRIREYCRELKAMQDLDGIDGWVFGDFSPAADAPPVTNAANRQLALKFKDYLFLRQLSSNLRTALATDLRSRRQPS